MRRLAALWLAATSAFAADFLTGQAARAVIGQPSFTAQTPPITTGIPPVSTTSASILGAASGLAYANGMLFVADDNRLGAVPDNNRVLIYRYIHQQVLAPTDAPAQGSRCPLCAATADIVLGQANFTSSAAALTQSGLLQPTAVASDGAHLVIADTNHNRLLIWNTIPASSNAPADLVLGQPDFTSAAPNNGTGNVNITSARSLRGPEGVWIQGPKLFVADGQNQRVLIWNTFPTQNFQPADVVLGQPGFATNLEPDLTKATVVTAANTLLNPVAVSSDGQRLFVTDLGNNRVLIWSSIPGQNQASADFVIGQPDMTTSFANYASKVISTNATTGVSVSQGVLCATNGTDSNSNPTFPARCAATLSFPRFTLSDGDRLFIADGGNDRVLIFNSIPTQSGARADIVLGQPDEFSVNTSDNTTTPSPFVARRAAADAIRTPTSLAWDGANLYVAEPFSRRVLVFSPGSSAALLPVRNAASLVVYSNGTLALSGAITEGNQVHIIINGTDYAYQVKKNDLLADVAQGLTDVINSSNNGAGDPNVVASPVTAVNQIHLTARTPGLAGNNITVTTNLSAGATISIAGGAMGGGNESATLAAGTLVSFFGDHLAEQTASAPSNANPLPTQLGGAEVYVDGIRVPLLYVSPTQINAQVPWEVGDGTSSSAYVRTVHGDGSATVSNAVGLPLVPANPGIFTFPGAEPRPAVAVHSSNYALGTVSVDGTATVGAVATITINSRAYTYTVKTNDTLFSIRDALIAAINAGDPQVQAFPGAQWWRVRLQAREPGAAGNGIPVSASYTGSVTMSATGATLCCASVAGQLIDNNHPAMPGETIVVYATGAGAVHEDAGGAAITPQTGWAYTGSAINVPSTFVSSVVGGRTANVIATRLLPGAVGLYEVQLELSSDLPTNPLTQGYIAQDVYISNLFTFPLVHP